MKLFPQLVVLALSLGTNLALGMAFFVVKAPVDDSNFNLVATKSLVGRPRDEIASSALNRSRLSKHDDSTGAVVSIQEKQIYSAIGWLDSVGLVFPNNFFARFGVSDEDANFIREASKSWIKQSNKIFANNVREVNDESGSYFHLQAASPQQIQALTETVLKDIRLFRAPEMLKQHVAQVVGNSQTIEELSEGGDIFFTTIAKGDHFKFISPSMNLKITVDELGEIEKNPENKGKLELIKLRYSHLIDIERTINMMNKE